MAAEKVFENKLKKYLKSKGAWVLKYWGGSVYTQAGVPDLLVCYKGKFIGIEVKAETGHASELQLNTIEQIKKAGGIAFVLFPRDYDKFVEWFETL